MCRKDLLVVEQLSRRLNDVVNHHTLYRSKPLTLSVTQSWNGDTFTLSTIDYGDPHPTQLKTFQYEYRHLYTEKKPYQETRKLLRGKRGVPTPCTYHSSRSKPITVTFCNQMAKLLNRFSASKVSISHFHGINDDFLTALSTSLMKAKTTKVYMEHSSFEDGTLNGFKMFADFLKSSTTDFVSYHCAQLVEWGFLNEKFFAIMNGSALTNMRSLEEWKTYQAKKFRPAKTILTLLTQYDTLILPSLTLNADWIGEFIMLHLEDRKPEFTWSFWMVSVDREISPYKIKEQFASPDFTHDVENGMHCVIKRSTGFKAHFHVVPIALDERRSYFMYLLDINFASPAPESYDRAYYRWFTQSHEERRRENVRIRRAGIRRTLGTADTPKKFETPLKHRKNWDELPSPLQSLALQ